MLRSWVRTPSPLSFILLISKYLSRTQRGNKGANSVEVFGSYNGDKVITGVGSWMTIPTSSKGIFRHFRPLHRRLVAVHSLRPRALGLRSKQNRISGCERAPRGTSG